MFFENDENDNTSCGTADSEQKIEKEFQEEVLDYMEGNVAQQKGEKGKESTGGGKQASSRPYEVSNKMVQGTRNRLLEQNPDCTFKDYLEALGYDNKAQRLVKSTQHCFDQAKEGIAEIQALHRDSMNENFAYWAAWKLREVPWKVLQQSALYVGADFFDTVEAARAGFQKGYEDVMDEKRKAPYFTLQAQCKEKIKGQTATAATWKERGAIENGFKDFSKDVIAKDENGNFTLPGHPNANLPFLTQVATSVTKRDTVTGFIPTNGVIVMNEPLQFGDKPPLYAIDLRHSSGWTMEVCSRTGLEGLPMGPQAYQEQLTFQEERVNTLENLFEEAGMDTRTFVSIFSSQHPSPEQPKNKLDQFAEKAIESLIGQPTKTGECKTAEFLQQILAQCGDGDGGDGSGDDTNKQLEAVLASLPEKLIQKVLNAHAVEQIITAIKEGLVTEEAVGKYLGVNVEFNAETNELTFTNNRGKELNLDEIPRLQSAGWVCRKLKEHCGTEQALQDSNEILAAINKNEQTNQELVQIPFGGIALKTSLKGNPNPYLEETTTYDLFAIRKVLDKIEGFTKQKEIVNLKGGQEEQQQKTIVNLNKQVAKVAAGFNNVKAGEQNGKQGGANAVQPFTPLVTVRGKTEVGATQDRGGGGHGM